MYDRGVDELFRDLPYAIAHLTPRARQVLAKLLSDVDWVTEWADIVDRYSD
jgi:hypothetical protein